MVWGAWLTVMAGVNLATPLYHGYADRFGFSSLVLTLIFAVYALVLVPTLLAFGRLSDRYGRRPVILAGMAAAALGLVLFAAAQGVAWLFAARILQGLAVGTVSGAATAAVVELDPERGGRMPALLAGLAQAGGNAVGPLLAGVLGEWAPAPDRLTYLAVLASTAAAAVVVMLVDEPGERSDEPWRVQVPRVPPEVRDDFVRVSTTAATVWAAVALYLSIGPSYAAELLHSDERRPARSDRRRAACRVVRRAGRRRPAGTAGTTGSGGRPGRARGGSCRADRRLAGALAAGPAGGGRSYRDRPRAGIRARPGRAERHGARHAAR